LPPLWLSSYRVGGAHILELPFLAQQVWRYASNIIWQLFAKKKEGNIGFWKYFSMMQCFFDQPLSISLKPFNHTWFFLRSGSSMDYLASME
jgi:hypothetical protein